jgi:hypothetical protein
LSLTNDEAPSCDESDEEGGSKAKKAISKLAAAHLGGRPGFVIQDFELPVVDSRFGIQGERSRGGGRRAGVCAGVGTAESAGKVC